MDIYSVKGEEAWMGTELENGRWGAAGFGYCYIMFSYGNIWLLKHDAYISSIQLLNEIETNKKYWTESGEAWRNGYDDTAIL